MSGEWRTGLALCAILHLAACGGEGPEAVASNYDYPDDAPACPPREAAPDPFQFRTAQGLEVRVRVPANYRPDRPHPLLVVYAGAGMTPSATERLTGLTPEATGAGYLVAYPQHIRPSRAALRKLAAVPREVAARHCVDDSRISLAGHSDGGTTATALAVMPDTPFRVARLVPSAAGFTARDLATFDCPAPTPVMVFHGAKDRLFPGWGREASAWWAGCNMCRGTELVPAAGTCRSYRDCAAPTYYCEGPQGHARWPQDAARQLTLFIGDAPPADERSPP